MDATRSTERISRRSGTIRAERQGGKVVAFPRRPGAPAPESSGTQPARAREGEVVPLELAAEVEVEVRRPEYLASELLAEDLTPVAPFSRTFRWGALALGAFGAAGSLWVGDLGFDALVLASLFVLASLASVVPLTCDLRGTVWTLTGLGGVGLASYRDLEAGALAEPLLLACSVVLGSALLFRAAHRVARLPRALVAAGLVGLAAWLPLSGGLDALMIEGTTWQMILPPVWRLGLGALVVLTTLSFLDPRGEGGARGFALALFAWLAANAVLALFLASSPARGIATSDLAPQVVGLSAPLMAILAAAGLMQVWILLTRRLARSRAST